MNANLSTLNIVREAIEQYRSLRRQLGNANLGLLLTDGCPRGVGYGMQELAEQCDVSDETIRRLPKPLIATGRVTFERQGRLHLYMASPEWAERVGASVRETIERLTSG